LDKIKRWRRLGLWQQLNDDLIEKAAAAMEQDDENTETPIYYDDDQLDEFVCGDDKEQFEQQIEFEMSALEVEEEKKLLVKKAEEKSDEEIMFERLENLEKSNEELKEQNNKMSEQLDLLVKLMTAGTQNPNNNNN
jgi:hypothetical protein